MPPPLVTVLTAVRNGMPYLPETVASIQAQTFTDWEYIIVDDASEDDTVSWIEGATRKDNRIHLVRLSERGGPFVAANAGLREAVGEFIVRVDADDLSLPMRIEMQVQALLREPRWIGCIANKVSFSDQGIIPGSNSVLPSAPEVLKWVFAMGTRASHSSLCFRREPVLKTGGYRPLPTSGDYHLITFLARSDQLLAQPQVLSHVRRHCRRLSKLSTGLQSTIGYQLAKEHLAAMTRQEWSQAETESLWAVGGPKIHDVKPALKALGKWRAGWQAATMAPAARQELKRICRGLKIAFLWTNFRYQVLSMLRGMRNSNPAKPEK